MLEAVELPAWTRLRRETERFDRHFAAARITPEKSDKISTISRVCAHFLT